MGSAKRTSDTIHDCLNLAKTLTESELAKLVKVIGEIQRDDWTLRGKDILRGIIRDFVLRCEMHDGKENTITIRRALDPLHTRRDM